MQVKLKFVCSHPVFIFAVLPAFVQSVERALVNMTDDVQQTNLYKNCLLLGEKVKIMKSALKRPTGINIGVCVRELSKVFVFFYLFLVFGFFCLFVCLFVLPQLVFPEAF